MFRRRRETFSPARKEQSFSSSSPHPSTYTLLFSPFLPFLPFRLVSTTIFKDLDRRSAPTLNSFTNAQATTPGPVCPQRFPDVRNETEALYRMPLARLRSLQYMRPRLARQSEDCLYLNLYVPTRKNSEGKGGKQAWNGNTDGQSCVVPKTSLSIPPRALLTAEI